MFDQMFENVRQATESTFKMQQDLFTKWAGMCPFVPAGPANGAADRIAKVQKKWADFTAQLVKKQGAALESQFSAGLKILDDAFRAAEAKEPEELRAKAVELWQNAIESLRKLCETQLADVQAAFAQWTELVILSAAPPAAKAPAA